MLFLKLMLGLIGVVICLIHWIKDIDNWELWFIREECFRMFHWMVRMEKSLHCLS